MQPSRLCRSGKRERDGMPVRLAVIVLLAGAATSGCDVNTALGDVHEARQLAAELMVQFTRASDASNLSVMADTDEAAKAFAAEAVQRTAAAEKDVEALRSVLQRLRFDDELNLLEQFRARFAEYRTLDRTILGLTGENTNLKAQRLSFTSAQEAGDAFSQSLAALEPSNDSTEGWRVKALAASAVASAREIQALHGPHIAEPEDAPMTRIEQRMASAEAAARRNLAALAPLVRPGSQAALSKATKALDRLIEVNRQIIHLSRRNTNVRSLALSLNQKRTVVAACEEHLHALQAALAKRGYARTR
jgi:hypothetical protein